MKPSKVSLYTRVAVAVLAGALLASSAAVAVAGPPAVVLTDNPAGPLVLNGFTRYTGDVSSLAGLDVRVGISVGLDHVSPTPHRAAVDNFRIVPEPTTLVMVCAGASLFRLGYRLNA